MKHILFMAHIFHIKIKFDTSLANFQRTRTFLCTGFSDPVLPPFSLEDTCGNIEKRNTKLPEWIKGAAKLLNGGAENQDWLALAKLLGEMLVIAGTRKHW